MNDYIQYNPQTGDWFLAIGREIYTYNDRRQQPLGRGGMGLVYIGRNHRTGERVAIKRVHDKYANIPEIRRRAREESAMAFSHPNIVEMIGCAESVSGQGTLFIVSRYVSGENIDSYVNHNFPGSIDVFDRQRRIVNMVMPVFDALQYLHDSNIVHLDIKPSNIMVESGHNIRLMDLGIALTCRSHSSNASMGNAQGSQSETTGSGLMGTPKYAAPEQFGEELGYGSIDHVTDIYELGVTIYEIIAGVNPFVGTSINETLQNHLNTTLPAAAKITKPVLNVLRRATAATKADRYQSVTKFRQALYKAANTKPTIWQKLFNR